MFSVRKQNRLRVGLAVVCCALLLFYGSSCKEQVQQFNIDMSTYSHDLYELMSAEGFTKIEMFTDSPRTSNLLYISALVNETEAVFFIDTGDNTTRLCKRFYKRSINQLSKTISTDMYDKDAISQDKLIRSKGEVDTTTQDTILQIGDTSIPFFDIPIVDLDSDNENRKRDGFIHIDGIIGSDILQVGKAIIDCIGMAIFIKPPTDKSSVNKEAINELLMNRGPNGFNAIAFNTKHRYLVSLVEVNNITGLFIIDTGANMTVIDRNRQDKFHLSSESFDIAVSTTLDDKSVAKAHERYPITIGNTELSILPVFLNIDSVNEDLSQHGLENVDGILGTDVLLLSVICYNNMQLYIINDD